MPRKEDDTNVEPMEVELDPTKVQSAEAGSPWAALQESVIVPAPTKLGRYALSKLIGKGGMAEVWLAKQDGPAGFEKTCVVKRIRRSLMEEKRFVEMFLREARIAARLNHPNVVQIFELGEHTDPNGNLDYFIAMEFLDGLSLHRAARRSWRNSESMPMEVALRATADAALGLHHAHTLVTGGRKTPLVHRDVSPDNIILTRDGIAKLLDFGIAKSLDVSESTGTGEVKGKIPFMSPEQLQGLPLDGRTDLWSLGVTLYWLLTGRRPFDGNTEPMTIDNIMRRDPDPPRAINPLVPATVDAVVMQLLQKDVSKRIGSGLELAEKLLAMLGPSSSYAAASSFLAHVGALQDDPAGQPVSVITIVAARPESQWLKKIDSQAEVLERLGPQLVTPPSHGMQLPVPPPTSPSASPGADPAESTMEDGRMPTGKTVTGVAAVARPTGTPTWPILAGVAAALLVGVGGWQLMRVPTPDAPPAGASRDGAPPPVHTPDAPGARAPDAPRDVRDGEKGAGADPSPGAAAPADAAGAPAEREAAAADGADGSNGEGGALAAGAADASPPEAGEAGNEPVERARRSADDRISVKASAPPRITWRVNGRSFGKGNTTLKLPKSGGKVTAYDPETGGSSVVPVVDGAASWQKLGQGKLVVRARPWAEVKLGPKALGQTPFDPVSLVEGHYEVVLTKDGVTKRVGVDVSAGKTATLNVDMRE